MIPKPKAAKVAAAVPVAVAAVVVIVLAIVVVVVVVAAAVVIVGGEARSRDFIIVSSHKPRPPLGLGSQLFLYECLAAFRNANARL